MTTSQVQPNERVTFKVAHEDEFLVVVNKPSGVVTAPGLGHEDDSLLNGVFAKWGSRLRSLGKARDYGLLHRLDRATSGLVLFALTPAAYDEMRRAFESRLVRKFYWAVVQGSVRDDSGVINKPILEGHGRSGHSGKNEDDKPKKLAFISPKGKPAVTAYRVLASRPAASLLECRAVTGRLHQLRVHLEAIGSPILGAELYARPAVKAAAPRLALHAHRLAFAHPVTGKALDIRSAWPTDLRALLRRLDLPRPDLADTESQGA